MKKVSIIIADYSSDFEAKVNDFLESHPKNIIDIQYQMAKDNNNFIHYSAMIIYEED